MSTHSAFRCKTPGCHALLGAVKGKGTAFKPAEEVEAVGVEDGVLVTCPVCGATRLWLDPAQRRRAA